MLTDYQITPEITLGCSNEILQKCQNGLEKEGRTLHCLFGLSQEENGLGPQCMQAVNCSFARLFAKLPRPGDSEVTFAAFESSCHLYLLTTSELAGLSPY